MQSMLGLSVARRSVRLPGAGRRTHDRTDRDATAGCPASRHFKDGDRSIGSVGFVQRTGFRATGRHVWHLKEATPMAGPSRHTHSNPTGEATCVSPPVGVRVEWRACRRRRTRIRWPSNGGAAGARAWTCRVPSEGGVVDRVLRRSPPDDVHRPSLPFPTGDSTFARALLVSPVIFLEDHLLQFGRRPFADPGGHVDIAVGVVNLCKATVPSVRLILDSCDPSGQHDSSRTPLAQNG